jgi:putative ABC transport system ATP-binding protein
MNIVADGVFVVIDGRTIVQDASLTCHVGTMTALVGPSGSGKTTLLHCLGLLQSPSRGRILVDQADTTGWNTGRRRRFWQHHAAFVLQDYGIIEDESVAYNVVLRSSLLGRRVPADRNRLLDALRRTGLQDRTRDPAAHLSGGEKQRLALARAIYKSATAVFVDEPTASLDEANRRTVIDLLRSRAAEGCTVVLSTHDDEAIAACDGVYSLDRGVPAVSGGS